jgi:superfamily II DNA or RNA helicase
MILRDYQEQATHHLRDAYREGARAVILYSPTGSGKTVMACDVVSRAVAKGSRVLFIGDSSEIIEQTSAALDQWSVPHGIIQGGRANRKPWENVHVATIQTLRNRELPPEDLVIVDECHLARAITWQRVIEHYRAAGARLLGLSATPVRLDQKGLGKLFDRLVYCPSIIDLTDQGWLVPVRIFAPPGPDLRGVHNQAGDFNKGELSAACDKRKLVGDVIAHWLKHAPGRLTAVSAVSIVHSQHLRDEFRAAGIPAEHVDGTTPREERKRILKGLEAGAFTVLCQVDICSKGWDCKPISCLVDARPTMSLARWLQFVGRGLRISPETGKADCILLDHAGNVRKFGMPDEEREWSLDGAEGVRVKPRDTVESVRMCKQCWMAFRSSEQTCPNCGWRYTGRLNDIEHEAGELQEIQRQRKQMAIQVWRERHPDDARRRKFDEFIRIGVERGYKPGFAIQRYRAIFLEDPPREWMQTAFVAARAGEGAAVNS